MGIWPFKRVSSLSKSGLMNGLTDWHSHILPGIDDGIPSMEKSLEVLRAYDEMGVSDLWLTPHIMEDFPNTTSALRQRFDELKGEWHGNVRLHLAAENMLDSLFEERLQNKDFLPIGEAGDHLLVETSYFNPPMNFDDLIDAVQDAGYNVLLAHPERYRYMNEADYKDLRRRGVRFQLNMMSTVGMYGETARKKSEWMLKNGMIEVIGTDLHRLEATRKFLQQSPQKKETVEHLLKISKTSEIEL